MFKQLFSSRKSRTRRQPRRRLAFQQLESRRLLAGDMPFVQLPQLDPVDDELPDLIALEVGTSQPQQESQEGTPRSEAADTSAPTPNATLNDVVITQIVDSTSPELFFEASGSVLGRGGIKLNLGSSNSLDSYLKAELRQRLITGYRGGGDPIEQIEVNFIKIEFSSPGFAESQDNAKPNDPSDDLVLPSRPNGELGEAFIFFAPSRISSRRASITPVGANEEPVLGTARGGLLGPGGIVDQNGAAANAENLDDDMLDVDEEPALRFGAGLRRYTNTLAGPSQAILDTTAFARLP